MEKQKNGELSRMFGYAGKFHVLTVLGCVLSGISTILSMLPFVCIWLVIRDLIHAFAAGDEATASLDVDNETEIQNAISRLVKGKTVLIIAHRMRTVEAADNIVVLSDGIVAENGTHEELMKENGLYHRLVDLQTASANWKLSV